MRPRKLEKSATDDLFRARLDQIIDMRHELVRLADAIDWDWLDEEIAGRFSDDGRPATESRFMIGVLLLKHIHALSDEYVFARWVENPYSQYFKGRHGDHVNAVLSAVGYNFRLILNWLRTLWRQILAAILVAPAPKSALSPAS